MNSVWRRAWMIPLAFLSLLAPFTVLAQDGNTPIRIDGSRIVADIVEPLSAAYEDETGATVEIDISGTSSGLSRLCSDDLEIATAARPISREEEAACAENGVEWVEVLLAYDALAVIANPTFSFVECLSLGDLTTLWGPSATDSVTTWGDISTRWEPTSFVLYTLPAGSTSYALLDGLLPGDGLRTDVTEQEDPAALINAVAEDVAGVGFAPLQAVTVSEAEVFTLSVDDLSGVGCTPPGQDTLEDGSYAAASGLYLYVSAASLEREDVAGLVQFLLSDDARALITEQNFTPTSEDLNTEVLAHVEEGVTGRQFSEGEPLYTIPLDVSGSVLVESAAAAFGGLNDVGTEFTGAYANANVTTTAFGNAAAYRELCHGETDLAGVTRPPTDEEAALCEENGVALWEVPLGHQAIVMLVPEAADFAACLTTEQIAALWQDQGEDTVTNWSQLGDDFPDLDLTIFLPRAGRSQTDFLLYQSSGQLLNPRRDALQENNDALYRAAATANVEGALTYVTYGEFLETEAAIIPIAVDAGDGCVEPALETIRDGSYLFSRPIMVQVNQEALSRPEVQSYVWYLLSPNGQSVLEDNDVIVFDEAVYTGYQEEAAARFAEAEALAAQEAEQQSEESQEPTPEEGTPENGAD